LASAAKAGVYFALYGTSELVPFPFVIVPFPARLYVPNLADALRSVLLMFKKISISARMGRARLPVVPSSRRKKFGFSRCGPRVQLESRGRRAVAKLGRLHNQFSFDRILMNVRPMMYEVLGISDAMVGESSFPNLNRVSQSFFHGVRVAAFDELKRTLERDSRWRQQQMKMLGHKHKGVQLKLSLPAIRVESLQEEAGHWFGYEQASSLPGDGCYEISPRR
jgi:hypothetical protein